MEILLCLFIMAMAAGMLVVSGALAFDEELPDSSAMCFKLAVREARYQAAVTRKPTVLRYEEEAAAFVIRDELGNQIGEPMPTPLDTKSGQLSIHFYAVLPTQGTHIQLITGEEKTEEVSTIVFHPDRSATPCHVEIMEAGVMDRFVLDPFSDTAFNL